MNREQNCGTQPFRSQPVFNNWDVVTEGWYLVCPAAKVPRGQVKGFTLCGQRIAIFRGQDERVRALDAFCPHMGADLANGKVAQNTLQCFFHQWRFDEGGKCVDIPCQSKIPAAAKVQNYAVEEKYGFIWVWPSAHAPRGVPEYPELEGREIWYEAGRPVYHPCHHHVCMINGIDAQHLKTVHNLSIDMELSIDEHADGRIVDYTMRGSWSRTVPRERLLRTLIGANYAYRMRYVDASIGMLTTMLETRLFGRGPALPPLRMIFAFTPLEPGRTRVQPIYLAPKGTGTRQNLAAFWRVQAQKWGFYFLRDEDGAVYDNIRFQTQNLLPMDKAVAKYVSYVNRLPASLWSTTQKMPNAYPNNIVTLASGSRQAKSP